MPRRGRYRAALPRDPARITRTRVAAVLFRVPPRRTARRHSAPLGATAAGSATRVVAVAGGA